MQLTANEELELRYMQARGFEWIARDESEEVYAYDIMPYIVEGYRGCRSGFYVSGVGDYMECVVGEYEFLNWKDEPLEIEKLLRENGWDVPLVEPKGNEL